MSNGAAVPPVCRCGAPATWLGQCRPCGRELLVAIELESRRSRRGPPARPSVEAEVLRVVADEIGRALHEYAEGGRDAKVIRKVHTGLRLALRGHFVGEEGAGS